MRGTLKPIVVVVVLVLAVVVAGCEATPTPDIEATVGAELNDALAAIPTSTPYPTYTPNPTHTPEPTGTPYPTPAPSATPSPYLLQANRASKDYTPFLENLKAALEDLGWVVEEQEGTIRPFLIVDRQSSRSSSGKIFLEYVYGNDMPKVTARTYYALNTPLNFEMLQAINTANLKWHIIKVWATEWEVLVSCGAYTFDPTLNVEKLSDYIQWYDKNIDKLVYEEMGLDDFLE